jgi:late competence protein required for DNA uptake (superfamily II DNA/RNA helicase)
MVDITILNGNEYVSCEKCGAYEFYEVSKLHVVQDGAKKFLCRQCMPVSCVVSKGQAI